MGAPSRPAFVWDLDPVFVSYLNAPPEFAFEFFGVDDYRFKLGERVFEAVRGETGLKDETRCFGIKLLGDRVRQDVYFTQAIAVVRIIRHDTLAWDGFTLEDVSDGYTWLAVGTRLTVGGTQADFRYTPRAPTGGLDLAEYSQTLRAKLRARGYKIGMFMEQKERDAIKEMFEDDPELRRRYR